MLVHIIWRRQQLDDSICVYVYVRIYECMSMYVLVYITEYMVTVYKHKLYSYVLVYDLL